MTTIASPRASTPRLRGLWIPLVTPFRDGRLDEASFARLVRHLAASPIDGFILAATTGEGLTLDDDETRRLVDLAADIVGGRLPLHLGMGGSDTRALVRRIEATRDWPIQGYLVPSPAYVRPSQEGLYRHFLAVADATDRPISLYNIPYRTGVNIANDTLLKLVAERSTIVGVKDCCSDAEQSFDLLARRPEGFSVLNGEDGQYYTALVHGADGGITASAHAAPSAFAQVLRDLRAGDQRSALAIWNDLAEIVRLFFSEPNPAPVKHWLWRAGLIASPELRLPMTGVTPALAGRIDRMMQARGAMRADAA